jgi:hypothetical protein
VGLGVPGFLARKDEALYLADRTSKALETINKAEALAERFEQLYSSGELHWLRGVFLTALVLPRQKLRLRSTRLSESQRSRSRFHWRNAQKQPTRNIADKKRARREDADSD